MGTDASPVAFTALSRPDYQRGGELFVFASQEHARRAGFGGVRLTHQQDPTLRAWWPTLGRDAIRGFIFSRVLITDGARRHAYGDAHKQRLLDEGMEEARWNLRAPPMLWIDL